MKFCVKTWMGSIFSSGLRDQILGKIGVRDQENWDPWVPDIPCYDPAILSLVV